MENSRGDSAWGALAAALGDPLAGNPLAERVAAIEQRIARARAAGTLVRAGSFDARMGALRAQLERGLAELEVKMKMQADALRERDQALAMEFGGQLAALEDQMLALHNGFAMAMGRLVEEQIDAGVAARFESLEARLRATIREELGRGVEAAADVPRELDVPAFARVEPRKPVWQVSFVSSFFAITCGLLALHYL